MFNYIRGAAKNNAYCFFELSRLYQEGVPEIGQEPNTKLQYLYLKRSAEEGFVTAQHLLGIAYSRGEIVRRNDHKALAWFRESVRNGNPVSYLNAGDILSHYNGIDEEQ
jgi:TPR repeat protein